MMVYMFLTSYLFTPSPPSHLPTINRRSSFSGGKEGCLIEEKYYFYFSFDLMALVELP
jgi:hypothetical protein